MGGGPPGFTQGSSCPALLWIQPPCSRFRVRGFHTLWPEFPFRSTSSYSDLCCPQPRSARTAVWALPISLAATFGIDVSFSSSAYLDVSVQRVPFHTLWIGVWMTGVCPAGFPHSEISGSMDICSSPKLIAAYHVFRRLLVPRHPPYALFCLTLIKIVWFVLVHFHGLVSFLRPNVNEIELVCFLLARVFAFRFSVSGIFVCKRYLMSFPICSFQGTHFGFRQVEMERFELLTPCLQGRCSPN